MDIDQSNTVVETQRTKLRFEVGERVGLLHHIHDTMVASAIISSIAVVVQLHNHDNLKVITRFLYRRLLLMMHPS